MQQSTKICEYLKTVCEQIRWRKAHGVISQELGNHIIDQKNTFIANGLDEKIATDKAIEEMGDPVIVGSALDRSYRPKPEWSIILLTIIALSLGLIIRLSINYIPYTNNTHNTQFFINNIIATAIGIGCMIIVYFIDFTIIGKYPKIIYFGFIAATIGAMLISPRVNEQLSYIKYILLLFPAVFAGVIYNMRNKGYLGVILSLLFLTIPTIVCINSSAFTSIILYSVVCLLILTLAIAKGWFNVKKLSAMLIIYVPPLLLLFVNKNILYKLQIAINPYLDPTGAGHLIISNARLFGQGRVGAEHGLPFIETDYLLMYLISSIGWISFIGIMMVILAFIIRSLMLCLRQKSILGKLVSLSVLLTFTMQVVLYVASNLGFQLFSILKLPLIFDGGISIVINMSLIGIMLSVFKSGHLVRDNQKSREMTKQLFKI